MNTRLVRAGGKLSISEVSHQLSGRKGHDPPVFWPSHQPARRTTTTMLT